MNAQRRHAPATERNREPIATVLDVELPDSGTVLEVASGTGEHIVYFAERFPRLRWQPSDPDPEALASIRAWRDSAALSNVVEPLCLDVRDDGWPVERVEAILCINMVHISPWAATLGLVKGAKRVLAAGSPLILYGPYLCSGAPTAPSNEAFDRSLRSRNRDWGLRSVEAVRDIAEANNLQFQRLVEMPANNLMLMFRRS